MSNLSKPKNTYVKKDLEGFSSQNNVVDAYSEPIQTSLMELCTKIVLEKLHLRFSTGF